jgi:predicted RNA binding protein YcfA (HicA-like mRNA interferase family)
MGWTVKADKGSSHKQMQHPQWGEATWAFHDSEEIGPKMLARLGEGVSLQAIGSVNRRSAWGGRLSAGLDYTRMHMRRLLA